MTDRTATEQGVLLEMMTARDHAHRVTGRLTVELEHAYMQIEASKVMQGGLEKRIVALQESKARMAGAPFEPLTAEQAREIGRPPEPIDHSNDPVEEFVHPEGTSGEAESEDFEPEPDGPRDALRRDDEQPLEDPRPEEPTPTRSVRETPYDGPVANLEQVSCRLKSIGRTLRVLLDTQERMMQRLHVLETRDADTRVQLNGIRAELNEAQNPSVDRGKIRSIVDELLGEGVSERLLDVQSRLEDRLKELVPQAVGPGVARAVKREIEDWVGKQLEGYLERGLEVRVKTEVVNQIATLATAPSPRRARTAKMGGAVKRTGVKRPTRRRIGIGVIL